MPSLSYGTLCNTIVFAYLCVFVSHVYEKRAHAVGALSEGKHPFSFRTRQLSPLEAMVLGASRGE